jgi:hypothetical protein
VQEVWIKHATSGYGKHNLPTRCENQTPLSGSITKNAHHPWIYLDEAYVPSTVSFPEISMISMWLMIRFVKIQTPTSRGYESPCVFIEVVLLLG